MQDTPVPSFFADLSATERATLFTDTSFARSKRPSRRSRTRANGADNATICPSS